MTKENYKNPVEEWPDFYDEWKPLKVPSPEEGAAMAHYMNVVAGLENWSIGPDMDFEGPMESRIKAHISTTGATVGNSIYKDIEHLGETLHSRLNTTNERIDRARAKIAIIHEAVEKNSEIIIAQLAELSVQMDAKIELKKTEKVVWFLLGLSIGVAAFCIGGLF